MNTLRQAAQQALEALEAMQSYAAAERKGLRICDEAITALRAALAEPEQEPVKWHHPECEGECIACLIERAVQEAYGSQGLAYLQRHLVSQPQPEPLGWITAGQHTAPLRTHWEGCEAVHPECRKPDTDCHAQGICQRSGYSIAPTPRKPPAYAGVTAWIGDATVTYCVTQAEIQYERVTGMSMEAAAEMCLKRLAAHGIGEQT